MNERGEATEGDLRARVVWHIQEAQRQCGVGAGCTNATFPGPCCELMAWVEIDVQEQMFVLPGRRKEAA